MIKNRSPFEPSSSQPNKIVLLYWLLISSGLFLITLALLQGQGWLEKEPNLYLTTTQDDQKEANIFVDIAGAVTNPGLYQLPAGSRIEDLLSACQGINQWADRDFLEKSLNRARILEDGEKIYVPYQVTKSTDKEQSNEVAEVKININQAGQEELMTLPGIGEKYALAIIAYRQEVGYFASIEEIQQVSGIGEKTFNQIKTKIEI